jgi:hypothetical protein
MVLAVVIIRVSQGVSDNQLDEINGIKYESKDELALEIHKIKRNILCIFISIN